LDDLLELSGGEFLCFFAYSSKYKYF